VVGGVNLTGAAVGRWHRIGSYRRGCFGMRCLVFTGDAMGFVGETLERFGLVRAVALGLDGLSWPLWCRGASLRPAIVQHEKQPQPSQQHELIEKKVWNHGQVSSLGNETGRVYLILGPIELSAA
jgi:hypothetical protein